MFMQTYTGLAFDFLSPDPDKIVIEDIAHALSLLCRYGGHTRRFYSVAEHSIFVSQLNHYRLEGLLHDATEAYLGDMIYPLKAALPAYKELEHNLMGVIAEKFNLTYPFPEIISIVDKRMLGTEREQAMLPCEKEWYHVGEPFPDLKLQFYDPKEAEERFLSRYYFLTGE